MSMSKAEFVEKVVGAIGEDEKILFSLVTASSARHLLVDCKGEALLNTLAYLLDNTSEMFDMDPPTVARFAAEIVSEWRLKHGTDAEKGDGAEEAGSDGDGV